jgi:hypothetical protein
MGSPHDLPFTNVVSSNIIYPQKAGHGLVQRSVTFNRRVHPVFVLEFLVLKVDALALFLYLRLRRSVL